MSLSLLNLLDNTNLKLTWEMLQPQCDFPSLPNQKVHFFDLQPRARSAINDFLVNPKRSILVLKSENHIEYANLLAEYLRNSTVLAQKPSYISYAVRQQALLSDPTIKVQINYSHPGSKSNSTSKLAEVAWYFDQNSLFGSAISSKPPANRTKLNLGLVHQLDGGVLIVNAEQLLADFTLWPRLKHIAINKIFDWFAADQRNPLVNQVPNCSLDLKVILLADRVTLAKLVNLDNTLYNFSHYSEIESYTTLLTVDQKVLWANYIQTLAQRLIIPPLSESGVDYLYRQLVRESEDRTIINISPVFMSAILYDVNNYKHENIPSLDAKDFDAYFAQRRFQQNFLQQQAYLDISNEQVYIATQGEEIGQINGLSVIEYAGSPVSFGEPCRISCIIQLGEGEVIDIERKNELAGNLHSKAMMIVQSCLANLLGFQTPLPFSAAIAFEQSYGDIDGDSASLAEFCVLLSALSNLPLPQSIAVTGSIDQMGLVHSVGGVNQKIEGFFAICSQRGLDGSQGVIIPHTTLNQVSLFGELLTAVEQNLFHIWAVKNVHQATEILFKRPLLEIDGDNNISLHKAINDRIESKSNAQNGHIFHKLWHKIRKKK